MKITKKEILNIIGITLIVISLIRIAILILYSSPIHIFWLCNHIPLIIGIAILFRNSFILSAEIALLFFGSLNWSLDFLSKLLFNKYLLGSTYEIFADLSANSIISIISHLSVLPLALIALFLMNKPEPKAWKISIIHMIILVPISLYFSQSFNINCLARPCVVWMSHSTLYPFFIFFGYLLIFVIPTSIILANLMKKKRTLS
ncbi:MAG: hypothetical protein NUV97_03595 [archaeon]|nr:hypothetical protein [archaeon]MCR4323898.1 hypothetical protein [Nanoarchaeota archaeon]